MNAKPEHHLKQLSSLTGPIWAIIGDPWITRSLAEYGEYSEGESELWAKLIKTGDTVFDIGANIGYFSRRLAEFVGPGGKVVAVEPALGEVCRANCSSFSTNIQIETYAVSDKKGSLKLDMSTARTNANWGGVHVSSEGDVSTEAITLDELSILHGYPSFLKVDVEGHELQVFKGGAKTLNNRPFLYFENDRDDKSKALLEFVMEMGYTCYWHFVPLYRPRNFAQSARNLFENVISINVLAVPKGVDFKLHHLIRSPSEYWKDAFAGTVGTKRTYRIPTVAPDDMPMNFSLKAMDLHREQRDEEANRLIESALKIEPTLTFALFVKGIIALSHGDFKTGWPLYELRNQQYGAEEWGGNRYPSRVYWDGKPTHRKLLLHREMGFGDTIQMLRYVPLIQKMCPNLILEVQSEMVSLAKTVTPRVFAEGERIDFDCHYPLLSLPFLLKTEIDSIPRGPYLRVEAEKPVNDLRWGICWYSSSKPTSDRIARYINQESLAPLEEFDFRSLQYEHNHWVDFLDTARTLSGLDLVITIDTSIAHLAGALGIPVWILIAKNCDYRWLQKRSDSPWYPSARLFRQKDAGDWSHVIENVRDALRRYKDGSSIIIS